MTAPTRPLAASVTILSLRVNIVVRLVRVLPIVLAATSALVWGSADFSGGKASRCARPLTVTVVSQVFCLPALVVCLLLVPGTPHVVDVGWGVGAGVAGFAGIVLLYRAPSGGAMAVVAIALVSPGPGGAAGQVTAGLIGMALLSGLCSGLFLTLLGQSAEGAGMWPPAAERINSILVGVLLMARIGMPFRLPRPVLGWTLLAGTLDVAANALSLAAVLQGHLSIVAAIASRYPASTVLLALAVGRGRLRPVRIAGLGLAAAALVLATT